MHDDGIYFDLPEDVYHADTALGSTDLRRLLISGPDYWWHSGFNPDHHPSSATPQQIFGRALHVAVLEGEQAFKSRYVRRPDDLERMTAAVKAKLTPNSEHVLPGDDYDRIGIAAKQIADNENLSTAFSGGMAEVSVFWSADVRGEPIRFKARFDYLKPRGIGDLKSIRNYIGISFPECCTRAVASWRYDIQAAHYLIARGTLPEFVATGRVHGDHDRDWLIGLCSTIGFAFQFVFFQADDAPIVWSRSVSPGNPILDIAERDRLRAIFRFQDYEKKFGRDRLWTLMDGADIAELTIDEMPRWYK